MAAAACGSPEVLVTQCFLAFFVTPTALKAACSGTGSPIERGGGNAVAEPGVLVLPYVGRPFQLHTGPRAGKAKMKRPGEAWATVPLNHTRAGPVPSGGGSSRVPISRSLSCVKIEKLVW